MLKLQAVQNKAARIVLRLSAHTMVTNDMLLDLHWLKVDQRIVFKILLLVHKFFIDSAPAYLSEQLVIINDSSRLLNIWYFNSRPGRRCFTYVAPRYWNKLDKDIRLLNDTEKFKKRLKTALMLNNNNILNAAQGYRV